MLANVLLLLTGLLASQAFERSARVIAGEEAQLGEFPYQVLLQHSSTSECGAALISDVWVITAAQCVLQDIADYTLTLGLYNKSNPDQGEPTVYNIAEIIVHENFTGGGRSPNDIALLRLPTPANLGGPYIDIVPLAHTGDNFDGQTAVFTGWGSLGGGPLPFPYVLQKKEMVIITREVCESYWAPDTIKDGNICAERFGPCARDTGGPLVVEGVLVGVFSWIGGNCDTASVYSDIAYFRQWINDKTGI